MIDIESAKLNPASAFKHPHDVILARELSREQKIDILRRWSYDEREMSVAEEENMAGYSDRGSVLDEVLKSLLELGVSDDEERHPPTKQG